VQDKSFNQEQGNVMKIMKKLVCAVAVAASMMGTAQAGAVLQDWVFNPAGAAGGGYGSGFTVLEYLDIIGNAFVQLTPDATGPTFSFTERATFRVAGYDGVGSLPANQYVTATFTAQGTGVFSGAFTFTGGTLSLYSNTAPAYGSTAGVFGADQGTKIATLDILPGGGGEVDGSGNPTNTGKVNVLTKATTPGGLAPDHFFRSNGADLAYEDILAFAFTNATATENPNPNFVKEVVCGWAGYSGPNVNCGTGAYANASGSNMILSNNGQFKLAEIPEPGSLALLGIAMLGAGVVRSKRSKQA
jgi:hypothetical protein